MKRKDYRRDWCKSYDFDELKERKWVQLNYNRLKDKDNLPYDPMMYACLIYIVKENPDCTTEQITEANPWLDLKKS